jgi:hypothetical protein
VREIPEQMDLMGKKIMFTKIKKKERKTSVKLLLSLPLYCLLQPRHQILTIRCKRVSFGCENYVPNTVKVIQVSIIKTPIA